MTIAKLIRASKEHAEAAYQIALTKHKREQREHARRTKKQGR